MFEIVTHRNWNDYTDILDEMFRIRHEIYVEQRGWIGLRRPNRREIDQFDNEDATYLLRLDAGRHVRGAVRLIPTERPHLFADVFSHLVDEGDVPRHPDACEMTRFFAWPDDEQGLTRKRLGNEMFCGLVEYLVSRRISLLTFVSDTFYIPGCLEMGWDVKPLGLPKPYREGICIGVKVPINPEMLESTRRVRGISGPLLTPAANRELIAA
jgi:acyl-homoserine lactone synthase